jgi:hypothetical protein
MGKLIKSNSYRKIQQDATMYQNFLLFHIYMKLNMFRATPPIIRSLKLHWWPLVFHMWEVVGRVDGGHCQAQYVPDNVHHLHVQ